MRDDFKESAEETQTAVSAVCVVGVILAGCAALYFLGVPVAARFMEEAHTAVRDASVSGMILTPSR